LSWRTKLEKSAKFVLVTLLEHVDPDGRAWVGVETIATGASFGSAQTVRNALQTLAKAGWLRIVPQTWTSLTNEQAAVGRKAPRRGDVGQAPNLYVVLDGKGNPACGQARPGLVRVSGPNLENTPLRISEGSPPKNQEGEPLSKLIGDQDPSEDHSMKESAERAPRVEQSTHISSKSPQKDAVKLEAWDVLVEVHAEKTKAVYGLPPLPPDMKRDQQEALAASLDGAAVEVQAKLRARTGTERELPDVRRELVARTINLYFKRDNEHLRKVKHALRDLPREFHARITEAMQLLLRESHDATPPRRVQLEQPTERVESADKPVEIAQQKQHEEPLERVDSADKPVEVVKPKVHERAAQQLPAPTNTALEARRIVEALNAKPQQELFKPSKSETPEIARPKKPAVSEQVQEKPEQDKPAQEKPTQDKFVQDKPSNKSFEQKQFEDKTFEDKPSPRLPRTPPVERPLGRSGAPRWGAIGPRPTKVRRVSKLTPDEVEPDEEHGMGSTSIK